VNLHSESEEPLPISQFVRLHTPLIVAHCQETDPSEFERLLKPDYSKDAFGLSRVSFFKPESALVPGTDEDKRYGKRSDYRFEVSGVHVRLTSQWFKGNPQQYRSFIQYLAAKDLMPGSQAEALIALVPTAASTKPPTTGIKKIAIGEAQNAWVRHVLDSLRPDSQSYGGKAGTWEKFGRQCAYCGIDVAWGSFDEDHVYSINYGLGLGENKRGNLVPACADCNGKKKAQDYTKFLLQMYPDDANEARRRIVQIKQHMADCDYVPLREDPSIDLRAVRGIIETWRARVKDLADDCISELHEVIGDRSGPAVRA
jgi:hypothetical protein